MNACKCIKHFLRQDQLEELSWTLEPTGQERTTVYLEGCSCQRPSRRQSHNVRVISEHPSVVEVKLICLLDAPENREPIFTPVHRIAA